MRAIDSTTGLSCLFAFGALAALASDAAAQEKPHAPRAPLPSETEVMNTWREEPGRTAHQRTFVSPDGRSRRGIASTTPRFDPATGRELSNDLAVGARGAEFVAAHGDGAVGIATHTDGAGSRLSFADGSTIRVSASTRLFSTREDGRSWSLSAIGVPGRLDGTDSVTYKGVFDGARLVHAARPGVLKTALVIDALPEPLQGLDKSDRAPGNVYFEEEILLPAGWTAEIPASANELREFRTATQRVAIRDARGVERAAFEAPVVYEENTPKEAAGHFAPAFAAIRQVGNRVTYRVGFPALWLADPARSLPVVIDPTLSRNVPITVSVDPTSITVSPQQIYWNAVAVSSATDDWDLDIGTGLSWRFPPDCDFLVANGNKGTISSVAGQVSRFGTGSASAVVEQAGDAGSITLGTNTTYAWGSTHIVHAWEIYVATPATRQLTVSGVPGLRFAIYRPGTDSAWRSRSSADYEFAVGSTAQSIDFNETGYWCLVAFKDGGAGASGTLSFNWNGSFNLAATQCTLDSATYPVTVQPSGMFSFTRNIVQTGTLPAGTQIDYAVYLSTNTLISTADHEVWSFQGAGTGVLQLTGFVPATIPAGTYYVGMLITSVPGESSTSDNTTYDSAATHRVVVSVPPVTPPTITLVQNQPQTAASTPTNVNFTVGANAWNILAVNGNDWNVTAGTISSSQTGAATDFLVANGHRGAITPATAQVVRASGTASASVEHDTGSAATAGSAASASFGAGELAKVFDIDVTATGNQTITVSGPTGLRCALFAPGTDASWRARSSATQEFAIGAATQVNFTAAGNWALVVFREGATAPAAGTVSIAWTPPPATFNLSVTCDLSGPTFPVSVLQGGAFDVSRTIAQTGTLPTGAQITYTIYLSADATITSQDVNLYSFSGAAPGTIVMNPSIPLTTAPGTYYVGVIIDTVQGESSVTDNVTVDSAANHRVVVTQATMVNLVQGQPVQATSTPTNFTLIPQTGSWNVVAVSATDDWDIEIGFGMSLNLGNECDFLVIDGANNVMTTGPASGRADQYGPVPTATLEHGAKFAVTAGTPASFQWNNTHICQMYELTVGTAGTPNLTLNAPTGLRFALFEPQLTADWLERNLAAQEFVVSPGVPQQLNLTTAGTWALILFRDGGPGGTSGAVDFAWTAGGGGTFNLAATSANLQGLVMPLNLSRGSAFNVGYAWSQTGTPPVGATLGLKVYLSADNVITAQDFEAASITGLQPTGGVAAATVPGTIPAGTYFVGVILNPLAGETSATDNAVADNIATHRIIVTGGGVSTGFDLAATLVGVPSGASVQPGQTLQVLRTISNMGVQASPTYAYAIYLSADATITPATDIKVFESSGQAALASGQSDSQSVSVTIPSTVAAGTYHVGLHVVQLQGDADATNSTAVASDTVAVSGTGGTPPPRGIKGSSGGGGGGGGCAIRGSGDASDAAGTLLPLVLAAAALALAGRRRKAAVVVAERA